MTEHEWLTTTDARAMFEHLRGPARSWPSRWFPWERTRKSSISDRKGRLLVLAWLHEFPGIAEHPVIRLFTDWADGRLSTTEAVKVQEVLQESQEAPDSSYEPLDAAGATFIQHFASLVAGGETCLLAMLHFTGNWPGRCERFREIFGNPFRPTVVEPAWLEWNAGAVAKLAHAIYQDDRFDEMPLLADALAEAGCTDATLLDHCRDATGHVRGCWVLDLLLGKEG